MKQERLTTIIYYFFSLPANTNTNNNHNHNAFMPKQTAQSTQTARTLLKVMTRPTDNDTTESDTNNNNNNNNNNMEDADKKNEDYLLQTEDFSSSSSSLDNSNNLYTSNSNGNGNSQKWNGNSQKWNNVYALGFNDDDDDAMDFYLESLSQDAQGQDEQDVDLLDNIDLDDLENMNVMIDNMNIMIDMDALSRVQNDVSNLSLPQIHLPPRFVPGVAWHHHHQATLRLMRQHRFRQKKEDHRQRQRLQAKKTETSTSEQSTSEQSLDNIINNNNNNKNNPVSNFLSSIMNRPSLVSSKNEWRRLQKHAEYMETTHLRDFLVETERCDAMYATHDGVYLDYSRQRVTLGTMKFLYALAEKQDLKGKIDAMVNGEKINFTEDRAVLHTALRAERELKGTVVVDGVDVIQEVHEVLDQVKDFTEGVRSGKIRGYTGKRLRNIVSVGIGGSYLGPEFLHECLKTEPEGINAALGYSLRFLSNVDPVDVERTCADLDPEETLIVIVSKTFTTAETMLNARTMRQWLWDFMGNDKEVVRKHMVACASVSATDKVEQFGIDTDNYFFRFWDWVGGRYSVCSAAGAVPISLLYGFDLFQKFLKGASSIDKHFVSAPFEKNIPVLMGLLGVWNMSFMKYPTRTTLPYAEALLKLPAHIQQLDMESNGKCMTKQGLEVDYPVGEIDFGEAGTNGQHSFYQLLHMGQTVPCDFIGFVQSQHDFCLDDESLSSHDELMANFFAQPDALANGKSADEVRAEGVPEHLIPHKVFKGNRPSLSLLLPKLTAYACGQLLAIYEHRTAVQGFIWDINSFDQWGVE
jgi:glucose-6-phosphate isomerase